MESLVFHWVSCYCKFSVTNGGWLCLVLCLEINRNARGKYVFFRGDILAYFDLEYRHRVECCWKQLLQPLVLGATINCSYFKALIEAISHTEKEEKENSRACPHCAKLIKKQANKCKHF